MEAFARAHGELRHGMPLIKPNVARERIQRARSASPRQVHYKLGKGGFDVNVPIGAECDCSGYLAWVLWLKRDRRYTGWRRLMFWRRHPWLESSNIHKDAMTTKEAFVPLRVPEEGAIEVIPDRNGHEGHVRVVTQAVPYRVIDCSPSNERNYGRAIVEHPAMPMVNSIWVCLKQDLV